MFKTPQEFAKQLFDLYFGNIEDAQIELFTACKSYPNVPGKFWRDCYLALDAMKIKDNYKDALNNYHSALLERYGSKQL